MTHTCGNTGVLPYVTVDTTIYGYRLITRRFTERTYGHHRCNRTHPRVRGPVTRTTLVIDIVTILLRDPGPTTRNYSRHRHYPTRSVRRPDVYHGRPSIVDSTITDPQLRVGVRRLSSQIHRVHHLNRTVLGSDTRHRTP